MDHARQDSIGPEVGDDTWLADSDDVAGIESIMEEVAAEIDDPRAVHPADIPVGLVAYD